MAGYKCCWKLKYDRSRLWIYSLLLALLIISPIASSDNTVLNVADANWTVILEGEWMLKFYAPWCPACQHLQNDWDGFAALSEALGISVGKVDVTQQPGLSGRFLVTTLPTIFHAKDGNFRRYMSSRSIEDFQAYISQQKWELVEPLPGWKSPSSFLMSGMAALFRLSVWIRQIHNYLTDILGIPSWGSYIIFALVTLFTGLLLGLMLVLIADFFWPSRPKQNELKAETKGLKDEGSEEEMEAPLVEERRAWDADNERVSGEDSTEDDATPVAEVADIATAPRGHSDPPTDLRKRRPQEPQDSSEGT
ncbi:thioredoxin-related transmembrane protein 4 isoform X2 [Clupea harengus]|uniref:Thioredoxin-related transmembrane protein 4 isoform X2 n=1 Tax=Clupea harengus TaxID=7950 RepID=A0A6P8GGS5_CLUHA|nr:thioredoxin-related transmembrane protein 4 isoform X2 [Clupea harengus]